MTSAHFVLTTLALALQGEEPPTDRSPHRSLRGVVFDASNYLPDKKRFATVSMVTVTLFEDRTGPSDVELRLSPLREPVLNGPDGSYAFEDITATRVAVSFERDGYLRNPDLLRALLEEDTSRLDSHLVRRVEEEESVPVPIVALVAFSARHVRGESVRDGYQAVWAHLDRYGISPVARTDLARQLVRLHQLGSSRDDLPQVVLDYSHLQPGQVQSLLRGFATPDGAFAAVQRDIPEAVRADGFRWTMRLRQGGHAAGWRDTVRTAWGEEYANLPDAEGLGTASILGDPELKRQFLEFLQSETYTFLERR